MSASAPLGKPSRNTGSVEADCTSATQIGVLVSVVMVQAAATSVIHMHRFAVSQVLHSSRKTGTLKGSSAVIERSDAVRRDGIGVSSGVVDVMDRKCRAYPSEGATAWTRDLGRSDNARSPSPRTHVKTYDIEMQRLKSARHDKGMIELGIDAAVLPRSAHDDASSSSSLRMPVEHARSLVILLKQQLAEVDKLQPRSRRSGRS
jgi:hypothetical protein